MSIGVGLRQQADRWIGKPVIVTGASGFIGNALVNRLFALGVDAYPTTRAAPIPSRPSCWRTVDLSDPESIDKMLAEIKPEVIFHLAGLATGSRDIDVVVPTMQANLVSTVNLLAAATRHHVGVVMSGSLEEPTPKELIEGASSPYSMAKWASTEYAALFQRLYGAKLTVLRIGMAYGPGEQSRSRLVPYVVDSLLCGVRPELSSGERKVDWVYIDDVVDALVAAAEPDRRASGPFDIGSGESTSIRATVEMIVDLLDSTVRPAFGARKDRPVDRDRIANLDATSTALDWRPRMPLRDGLRTTIDWHRARQLQDKSRVAAENNNSGIS